MVSAARQQGGSVWEGLYRMVMRRTPIYVTFVVVGAFLGERAVDYGVRTIWEHNNVGVQLPGILSGAVKRYEDISVLGQRPSDE